MTERTIKKQAIIPRLDGIQQDVEEVLPDLISLGSEEHFLTDYGDEGNYLLPWDIFTKESADEAFHAAKNCFERCKELIEEIRRWRDENSKS